MARSSENRVNVGIDMISAVIATVDDGDYSEAIKDDVSVLPSNTEDVGLKVDSNHYRKVPGLKTLDHPGENGFTSKTQRKSSAGKNSAERNESESGNPNGKRHVNDGNIKKNLWAKKRRRVDCRESVNANGSIDFSNSKELDEERRETANKCDTQPAGMSYLPEKAEARTCRQKTKRPRTINKEKTVVREKESWHDTSKETDNSRMNGSNVETNGSPEGTNSNELDGDREDANVRRSCVEGTSSNGKEKEQSQKKLGRQKGEACRGILDDMELEENGEMVTLRRTENRENIYPSDPSSPRTSSGIKDGGHCRGSSKDWNTVNRNVKQKSDSSADENGGGVDTSGDANGCTNGKSSNGVGAACSGTGSADGTSNACFKTRARRYETVVHGCVAVGCAQWCTDKAMRVTMAVGPKALLAMLGVGSVGRNVLDALSDTMVENTHDLRRRYGSAIKGQRFQWTVAQGRRKFVIIVAPFRKKTGADICGISGLILELTQSRI